MPYVVGGHEQLGRTGQVSRQDKQARFVQRCDVERKKERKERKGKERKGRCHTHAKRERECVCV